MNTELDDVRINHTMLIEPLRFALLFTIVIAAYDVGKAILSFIELVRNPNMDVLLVILWLLAAPFTFCAAVFFFYAAKRLVEGARPSLAITIGFGLMILSSVATLISQVSILDGNGLSIMILCGLVLLCYIICFLYYQRIGTKLLTWFAGVMGVLCGGYYLISGIKLVIDDPDQVLGYLFTSYLTAFLIAVSVLLFVLCIGFGPVIVDKTEEK